MDIVWLMDFDALVAQKNFSRAAEDRNVSQPAFSRRIRALEDSVGVRLINRQTLPLSLTPAGEVFASQAKLMLRTFHETIERCQTIDAASENVIRFATSQSLYITHYKDYIAPLVEQGKLDTDLNSTSWSADQFVTALQQNYCDVILTYWHSSMDYLSPLEVSKCDYVTLAKERFIPVSKANPDGSAMFSFPAKQKRSVPVLSFGSASALRSVREYVLRQHLQPPELFTVNQSASAVSVKAMIKEGFGLGWLPMCLCQNELKTGEFVQAAPKTFETELEVRLYKFADNPKRNLERLWSKLI